MSTVEAVWAISALCAFALLPVAAVRMLAYRSGEVDHTPALRAVAVMALVLGSAAFLTFVALTVWFVLTGRRPL